MNHTHKHEAERQPREQSKEMPKDADLSVQSQGIGPRRKKAVINTLHT